MRGRRRQSSGQPWTPPTEVSMTVSSVVRKVPHHSLSSRVFIGNVSFSFSVSFLTCFLDICSQCLLSCLSNYMQLITVL